MSCLGPGPAAAPEEIPKQRDMLVATAHEDPVAWRYTFQAPAADWFDTPFKDSTWDEGSAGFALKKIIREPAFVVRTVWDTPRGTTRRAALRSLAGGSLILPGILSELLAAEERVSPSTDPLAPKASHFPARAKRVIFI